MKGTAALIAPIAENTIKQVKQDRDERIKNHRKRNAKMMLEDVWKQFAFKRVQEGEDEAFRYILQNTIITGLIHRISKSFYASWKKNSRLSLHDFESVAYEKVWKIIANYSPHYQEWFLYEQLNNGIKQACMMLLRTEGLTKDRNNHKNSEYHKSLNLNEELIAGTDNVENNLLIKESLQEAINTLNENELKVYNIYLNADNVEDVALKDICSKLNLKHRQQAKRILDNLRMKLENVL